MRIVSPMSALGYKRTSAVQYAMVRCTPEADMCGALALCPLSANSGHQLSLTF